MGPRSDARQRFLEPAGLDRPAAPHPGQRLAGRSRGAVLHRDHRRGLHSAVHHAGRRRPDFRPDGADLCLRPGGRADRDLHGHAMSCFADRPGAARGSRDHRRAQAARRLYAGAALVAGPAQVHRRDRADLPRRVGLRRIAPGLGIPADARRGQSVDSRHHAADHLAGSRHADREQDPRHHAAPSRSHHRGVAARPARRRQRCGGLLQCGILRAAQAVRSMAHRLDQGEADRRIANRIRQRVRRHRFQFLAIYPGQRRGRIVRRQRRQFGKNHRAGPRHAGADRQGRHARNGASAGHYRSRRVLGARPAEFEHPGRSRQGGALWAQRQRRQQCRASGAGRRRGDQSAGGRPPIRRRGAAGAASFARTSTTCAISRSACRRPRATPISR